MSDKLNLLLRIDPITKDCGLHYRNDQMRKILNVDESLTLIVDLHPDGKVVTDSLIKQVSSVACLYPKAQEDLKGIFDALLKVIADKPLSVGMSMPRFIGLNRLIRIVPQVTTATAVEIPPYLVTYRLRVLYRGVEVGNDSGTTQSLRLLPALILYVSENYDLFNGTRRELNAIVGLLKSIVARELDNCALESAAGSSWVVGEFEFELELTKQGDTE